MSIIWVWYAYAPNIAPGPAKLYDTYIIRRFTSVEMFVDGILARLEDEVEDLIDEDEPQYGSPPITVTYSP